MEHCKRTALSFFLFTATAVAAVAHGAELTTSDQRFIEHAAQVNTFETEASEWAARNAEHDDVKRYADMMIQDHGNVSRELKALAAAKGVTLPTDLPAGESRSLKTLRAETGTRLDEDYVDKVAVAAHKEAVQEFVDAAEHAKDPEVKAFAQQTLPVLKAHWEAGMALRKSLSASGKASPGENAGPAGGAGGVSPASRQAPPSLLPGDKGAAPAPER
ncbi:hypothetical protein CAL14_03610 [Bordetella genomosp. 9]|uniref:DUF4142 domain-containing protein n=1 Tax=Bordetella genomosp. 9 TaxID=1416803 RepID=UPI000A28E887|nr:DUF4142 domain-containing protein [Bordetella genomosp. 9]ARP89488.1 hypothetical protein CAL14_03610 [Bordetella genomosp. 9]